MQEERKERKVVCNLPPVFAAVVDNVVDDLGLLMFVLSNNFVRYLCFCRHTLFAHGDKNQCLCRQQKTEIKKRLLLLLHWLMMVIFCFVLSSLSLSSSSLFSSPSPFFFFHFQFFFLTLFVFYVDID